jgi:N-acetylglucosaminyldiphosphoundecaprenol N-acetyl-beta-D-mannosaminyltransferase
MKTFSEIPILNTRFHQVTVEDLIEYIVNAAHLDHQTIIGHANIRAMNFAQDLRWYQDFLNNADLVFCDGFGVLLGAKLCGHCVESKHRMTCPDYIETLAKACEATNTSLFLLAGRPGVVDRAIVKLQAIAPQLKIQGHHGHFDKTGPENDAVIEKINRFNPDVLYIGFGMPLQEQWILQNRDRVRTRVFLPLGACLDFYTNTIYRGPTWITSSGFEWLTRLLTEPGRLWKRYLLGNLLFFYRLLMNRIWTQMKKINRIFLPSARKTRSTQK